MLEKHATVDVFAECGGARATSGGAGANSEQRDSRVFDRDLKTMPESLSQLRTANAVSATAKKQCRKAAL
jgi:hypothetical protein